MFNKLSLKYKIIIGGLSPLIFVALINLVGLMNFNGMLDSFKWIDHTHHIIKEAIKVEKMAVDMETGMRGFLACGVF
jgi:methyl-accepting chemotaxis protein